MIEGLLKNRTFPAGANEIEREMDWKWYGSREKIPGLPMTAENYWREALQAPTLELTADWGPVRKELNDDDLWWGDWEEMPGLEEWIRETFGLGDGNHFKLSGV